MSGTMTRKEFLQSAGIGLSALLCASQGYGLSSDARDRSKSIKGRISRKDGPAKPWKWSIEAFDYASHGNKVQCPFYPNPGFHHSRASTFQLQSEAGHHLIL